MTTPELKPQLAVSRARVEGAFTALAAGDALGWPHEFLSRKQRVTPTAVFRDWQRQGGGRFYPHTEIIRAGEYSDDTQLTLAVARSRLTAGASWWSYFTRNELPLWTLYERGGGGATKRAAGSWLRGLPPWKQSHGDAVDRYFHAGGNGVAMRIVPHAVIHAEEDEPSAMLRDVVLDGTATHGHPRALVGAAAYAYAAWWLLRTQHTVGFGELITVLLDTASSWGALHELANGWHEAANKSLRDYQKAWGDVVEEMRKLLVLAREGLAAGALSDDDDVLNRMGAFGREKGAGTISAAAAIYLTARHAAQPVQGVLRAAFALGADTDTIAAMTGGLVGALAGSDWLPPEWGAVQDSQYLRQIANKVTARGTPPEAPADHPVVTARALDVIMQNLVGGHQGDLDFGGTRQARIVSLYRPTPANPSISIAGWQLETSDGQTVYVTKLEKKSKDVGQAAASRRPSEPPPRQTQPRTSEEFEVRAGGVKLTVSNLTASAAFYGRLGLAHTKKSNRFVQFGALSLVDAQTAFELSGRLISLEPANQRNRIELHVNDIHAAHARVTALGAGPVHPIVELPWGERSFHCFDPDGNIVEVIEKRLGKETTWRR
ncbi:ADP-ribosylglycohydrolase family protein [Sorangium sp. So ce1024]|uniref:ADP-ribosylglycohydrolase family protein n=1 Tax=Sorangium sp. So ce1024 TaxID=3133327 RepID=UPI003F046AC4